MRFEKKFAPIASPEAIELLTDIVIEAAEFDPSVKWFSLGEAMVRAVNLAKDGVEQGVC